MAQRRHSRRCVAAAAAAAVFAFGDAAFRTGFRVAIGRVLNRRKERERVEETSNYRQVAGLVGALSAYV